MLACSDRGIFTEVDLTNSRHVAAVNAPTLEDPGVPAPLSAGLLSLTKTAMDPNTEGQDMGLD